METLQKWFHRKENYQNFLAMLVDKFNNIGTNDIFEDNFFQIWSYIYISVLSKLVPFECKKT